MLATWVKTLYKMGKQTPIPPKSRMKPRKSQNAPFSHSWFVGRRRGGGGGYKFSICFFQGWSSPERFGANFGARQEKLRKESLQLRLWNSNSLSNREEKSLRHVAMVAKFLDDNKTKTPLKKWIRTVSKFIDLIQFHLICKILAKLSGVESERTVSELRKRKRNSCAVFTSLGSWRYFVVVEWDLAVTSGVSREK